MARTLYIYPASVSQDSAGVAWTASAGTILAALQAPGGATVSCPLDVGDISNNIDFVFGNVIAQLPAGITAANVTGVYLEMGKSQSGANAVVNLSARFRTTLNVGSNLTSSGSQIGYWAATETWGDNVDGDELLGLTAATHLASSDFRVRLQVAEENDAGDATAILDFVRLVVHFSVPTDVVLNPQQILGNYLSLWLRDSVGVLNESDAAPSDGDLVKTWQDQSLSANHASQSTSSLRPKYVDRHGVKSIEFGAKWLLPSAVIDPTSLSLSNLNLSAAAGCAVLVCCQYNSTGAEGGGNAGAVFAPALNSGDPFNGNIRTENAKGEYAVYAAGAYRVTGKYARVDPHVVGWSHVGGGATTFHYNDETVSLGTNLNGSNSATHPRIGRRSNGSSEGQGFQGGVKEIVVANLKPSDTDLALVKRWLYAQHNVVANPERVVIAVGSSSMQGCAVTDNMNVLRLAIRRGYMPECAVFNFAWGGESVASMTTRSNTNAQPVANTFTLPVELWVWAGQNDIGGTAGDTVYGSIRTFMDDWWADVANLQRVKLGTILSTGAGATREARRIVYNNLVLTGAGLGDEYEAVMDFASDPTIGTLTAHSNTTYFNADAVHMISAGFAIAANYAGIHPDRLDVVRPTNQFEGSWSIEGFFNGEGVSVGTKFARPLATLDGADFDTLEAIAASSNGLGHYFDSPAPVLAMLAPSVGLQPGVGVVRVIVTEEDRAQREAVASNGYRSRDSFTEAFIRNPDIEPFVAGAFARARYEGRSRFGFNCATADAATAVLPWIQNNSGAVRNIDADESPELAGKFYPLRDAGVAITHTAKMALRAFADNDTLLSDAVSWTMRATFLRAPFCIDASVQGCVQSGNQSQAPFPIGTAQTVSLGAVLTHTIGSNANDEVYSDGSLTQVIEIYGSGMPTLGDGPGQIPASGGYIYVSSGTGAGQLVRYAQAIVATTPSAGLIFVFIPTAATDDVYSFSTPPAASSVIHIGRVELVTVELSPTGQAGWVSRGVVVEAARSAQNYQSGEVVWYSVEAQAQGVTEGWLFIPYGVAGSYATQRARIRSRFAQPILSELSPDVVWQVLSENGADVVVDMKLFYDDAIAAVGEQLDVLWAGASAHGATGTDAGFCDPDTDRTFESRHSAMLEGAAANTPPAAAMTCLYSNRQGPYLHQMSSAGREGGESFYSRSGNDQVVADWLDLLDEMNVDVTKPPTEEPVVVAEMAASAGIYPKDFGI